MTRGSVLRLRHDQIGLCTLSLGVRERHYYFYSQTLLILEYFLSKQFPTSSQWTSLDHRSHLFTDLVISGIFVSKGSRKLTSCFDYLLGCSWDWEILGNSSTDKTEVVLVLLVVQNTAKYSEINLLVTWSDHFSLCLKLYWPLFVLHCRYYVAFDCSYSCSG